MINYIRIQRWACMSIPAAILAFAGTAYAQNRLNLAPNNQIRPQTDSQRLENFRPPPPPPTSYPNISRDRQGEPRLNINRDVSLGGNVTRDSAQGNVRFPIPGK